MPMLREQGEWPAGRVIQLQHHSEVLKTNPWEDPFSRLLTVYLPAEYNEQGKPYSTLWDLAAFTNSGPGHVSWRNHGENLPQRLDRLIGQGVMPPQVVVMPDCYTTLGGNQYVNSPSVGLYADYLVKELVPFVSRQLNVVDDRTGRALFGKSSGGYGALFHAMFYPETWGAAASHSGDVGFELLFRGAFPETCAHLSSYGGDIDRFISKFWSANKLSGRDFTTLMILAMAASYDPDPVHPEKIRLPFDLTSCTLDPDRWAQWLSFDPLNLIEKYSDNLKKLRALYIDVGTYDQYHIQFGTRSMVKRLEQLDVPHFFEEFDGSHSGIDWRLDFSLPYLANALNYAHEEAS